MKIALVAGELSGDFLGGGLLAALREQIPDLQTEGVGGPAMLAQGMTSHYPLETLSVMGLVEVLRHYPRLKRCHTRIGDFFLNWRPDVFVGIDAPDFNLPLEKRLKQAGIPTVHYVSPTVWAWREGRMKTIRRSCDLVLTLFPFEAAYYERRNMPVRYVGHPLAAEIPFEPDHSDARAALDLKAEKNWLALLPGSRASEVSRLAPPFLRTVQWLAPRRPDLGYVVALANPTCRELFEQAMRATGELPPLRLVDGDARRVQSAADVVLCASGTATLEATLLKRPQVVAYRMSPATWWLAQRLVKIPWVSLPNLLADAELVPEFLQHDAVPDKLGPAVLHWLEDTAALARVQEKFMELHRELRRESNRLAAEAVLGIVAADKHR